MTFLTTDYTPVDTDLYIDQSDSFSQVITLLDSLGQPLNITGVTLTASLKRYFNSSKDYSLHAEVYGDGVNGQIRLYMSAAETALLIDPRYVYSVKGATGLITVKVLGGQVLINPTA